MCTITVAMSLLAEICGFVELQLEFHFVIPNRHILVFFCLCLILWLKSRVVRSCDPADCKFHP